MSSPHSPDLDQLLSKLLDGSWRESDQAQLEDRLLDDSDARTKYLELMLTHAAMQEAFSHASAETQDELEELRLCAQTVGGEILPGSVETPSDTPPANALLGFLGRLPAAIHPAYHPVWFLAAAAVLTSLFWIVLVLVVWPGGERQRVDGRAPATAETPDRMPAGFIARILHAEEVVWATGSPPLRPGTFLVAGQRLELASGLLQVLFADGARTVVEGPAELVVDARGAMTLDSGRMLARVPPASSGFSVQTEIVDLVDLGTEFGVDLAAQSVDVQVFEGTIEARRHGGDAEEPARRLVAGTAAEFGNSPHFGFYVEEKEMNRAIYLSLAAMLSLPMATPTQGAIVLVDFGRSDNETNLPGWNDVSVTPGGPFGLVDSTGSATGFQLVVSETGVTGIGGSGSDYTGSYPAEVSGFPDSANEDNFHIGGSTAGTLTATLSMLDPSLTYDFLFYGAASNIGDPTTWVVTGQNSGSASITSTLNNATDVAIVSGIIPDGNATISIHIEQEADMISRWNVMQITVSAIPEPASGALIGGGTDAARNLLCIRRDSPAEQMTPRKGIVPCRCVRFCWLDC